MIDSVRTIHNSVYQWWLSTHSCFRTLFWIHIMQVYAKKVNSNWLSQQLFPSKQPSTHKLMVLNQSLLMIHFIHQHSHEIVDRRYAFQMESRWQRLCFFHATIKYAYISSTWLVHILLISYSNHSRQSYRKV